MTVFGYDSVLHAMVDGNPRLCAENDKPSKDHIYDRLHYRQGLNNALCIRHIRESYRKSRSKRIGFGLPLLCDFNRLISKSAAGGMKVKLVLRESSSLMYWKVNVE